MNDETAKQTDRTLIALLVALVIWLFAMIFLLGFLDRGLPSRILLTSAGCQVARMAGAQILEDQQQTCALRGYYRGGVLHDGATIDQGAGLRFDVGAGAIAGRVDDDSYSSSRGSSQIIHGWISAGLFLLGGMILLSGMFGQRR